MTSISPMPSRASSPLSPRASLPTLPPELLNDIFLAAPPAPPVLRESDEPLCLHPSSIPICRALLPFTRANAYRHTSVHGDAALAELGETLERNPALGKLVRIVELKEGSARSRCLGSPSVEHDTDGDVTMQDAGDAAAALEAAARQAFDHLPHLDEVLISRSSPGTLLSSSVLSSRAFSAPGAEGKGLKLVLDGDEPVSFSALRELHCAKGVREVEVRGRMRMKSDAVGVFEGVESAVERVAIESEPHAVGFSAFLEHVNLKEIALRCFTTDPHQVFSAFGPKARSRVEKIEFSTSGYYQREIGLAFTNFPSLRHLSLRSSSLILSTPFFASLRALLSLETLSLRGPVARGTGDVGAVETVELVADFLESVGAYGGLDALRRVELDVARPTGLEWWRRIQAEAEERKEEKVVGQADGEQDEMRPPASRFEVHVARLAAAAQRLGIELGGSVVDLVPRAH
ncbi:hypothetical protein JCM10207_005285 [Rhodosporidiobolus poonsookiae]